MTDERLAEIMGLTADVVAGRIHVRFDEETAWLAILDLRREVERLRAREAAMREVVEAVATGATLLAQPVYPSYEGLQDTEAEPEGHLWVCADCKCAASSDEHDDRAWANATILHLSDCPVTKARELLRVETE